MGEPTSIAAVTSPDRSDDEGSFNEFIKVTAQMAGETTRFTAHENELHGFTCNG